MNVETLESQVTSLRTSVAELERKVAVLEKRPNANWLSSVLGRFQNDPEFGDAMEQAKAFRSSGGFPDDTPIEK